jgi:hypothetical protein
MKDKESSSFVMGIDSITYNKILSGSSSREKKLRLHFNFQNHLSFSHSTISLVKSSSWSELLPPNGSHKGATTVQWSNQNLVDPPQLNFLIKMSWVQSPSTPLIAPKLIKSFHHKDNLFSLPTNKLHAQHLHI